ALAHATHGLAFAVAGTRRAPRPVRPAVHRGGPARDRSGRSRVRSGRPPRGDARSWSGRRECRRHLTAMEGDIRRPRRRVFRSRLRAQCGLPRGEQDRLRSMSAMARMGPRSIVIGAALAILLAGAAPGGAVTLFGLVDTGELYSSANGGTTWAAQSTLPV